MFFYLAFYATASHWKVWPRSQLALLSQGEMMSLLSSVRLLSLSGLEHEITLTRRWRKMVALRHARLSARCGSSQFLIVLCELSRSASSLSLWQGR